MTPPVYLNYVYCDHPASFANAVFFLRSAPYLILDCEGNNLGRAEGSVTLICVGTPFAEHIFLFDMLSPFLTRRDIDGLLHLFSDENILKIVWDGRMDHLEIWTTYGVSLQGVLDLQVAEVMSRFYIRGEGEDARARRLRNHLSIPAAKKLTGRYDGLHAVIGLQRCWKECGYTEESGKDPEVMSMHKSMGSAMWSYRPLSEQLLQYAAKDILLIGVLYPHFCRSGWIPRDPVQYAVLLAQCQRYVSAHVEQGKSANADVFRPCGIVPLDVLTEPFGPKFICFACNRALSISAFEMQPKPPLQTSKAVLNETTAPLRSTRCRLCFALALKNNPNLDQTWLNA